MTSYGTSYFVSFETACRYYKDYFETPKDVKRKISEGLIHIGRPPVTQGQFVGLTDNGTRYTIEEYPLAPKPQDFDTSTLPLFGDGHKQKEMF